MRKMGWVVLALCLFVLASASAAHGDAVFAGETFGITGTATQTGGSVCCTHSGTLTGTFTIGSEIGSSSDWTLSAFNPVCILGMDSCSSATWNFTAVEFDASNDTFNGVISTTYTGGGGDMRGLSITFTDGNTTLDPYISPDFTTPYNAAEMARSATVLRRCQNHP